MFQVASCTLDASAKIYAYRVDCVHSDTLKMAGGLGRSKQMGNEERNADNEIEEMREQGASEEVKKKKVRYLCIIANNAHELLFILVVCYLTEKYWVLMLGYNALEMYKHKLDSL